MTTITICQAEAGDLDAVRALMGRYVGWQHQRHAAHLAMIDRYFDPASFEAELASLPGRYAPPRGRLLLARFCGQPAGCIALRDLGGGAGEMKRLFVAPEHQGRGIGLALAERLLAEARDVGYRVVRLDTGPLQYEAHGLYKHLGFQPTVPYYDVDVEMAKFLLFMERKLPLRMGLSQNASSNLGKSAISAAVGAAPESSIGQFSNRRIDCVRWT